MIQKIHVAPNGPSLFVGPDAQRNRIRLYIVVPIELFRLRFFMYRGFQLNVAE